ncbi:nucleoside 2-deoxyribosyltransferase [Idiomarina tyrosinivorans]|uniref:Nucleoside 2-deoxyribosyltransferase n=1 Tax=Idiomarina tyrosinivorans TaxID=1445662 RepID=A0A432ZSY8_9GAMM|nr:nucleoside 2-deoxyribosyltransferase [Idiomarina tyrosinivorans]RUO80951.1 nucleoside 2-deoxyribosyltransferase [Idiomarina tyrosinivorans]
MREITIVGGVYGEVCDFPRNQTIRGSAGRSAVALASEAKTSLFAFIDSEMEREFRAICNNNNVHETLFSREDPIWFRYRHPLSSPVRYDTNKEYTLGSEVTADQCLVFGTIENRPEVHANNVVYDPQNVNTASSFSSNGSKANSVIYVVSLLEGKVLTQCEEPKNIASKIMTFDNVTGVIVKCGPLGAFVTDRNESEWVPCFPSTKVYKIGTGDIYSAAIALFHLLDGVSLRDSAWYASAAVSRYVESPIERLLFEKKDEIVNIAKRMMDQKRPYQPKSLSNKKVYLAGPFFNTAQQWLIDEARETLQGFGLEVFSPIHDVGEGAYDEVASLDIAGIDASDIVLAIVDGNDSGTLFEVGYARGRDIKVIAIAESCDEQNLTMIRGSGCGVAGDFATGIYAVCWELLADD